MVDSEEWEMEVRLNRVDKFWVKGKMVYGK